MTTLEQKAREYSNYALAQDGYITGYTEALRWRDIPPPETLTHNNLTPKTLHPPIQ